MRILYVPNEYSQQRQREKKVTIYPVHLAMEATYRMNNGDEVEWGKQTKGFDTIITEPEGLPFLKLPAPDRKLTNAKDRKYQSYGNYKFHPATHMMAALDCWYAKCNFCSWAKKYPIVQTRSIESVISELKTLTSEGFKEVFDDSGTFPIGNWLREFCGRKIKEGLSIKMGCNMRIVKGIDWKLLKHAGFRMILFGVESFNQYTLDKLNKGILASDILPVIKDAANAGLEPHAAIMTGYPWESLREERNTFDMLKYLLRKGYAKTAQVSIYDVNKQKIDRGLKKSIYDVALCPDFWINKIKDIKKYEDLIYLFKGIKKGICRD
jgi:radical SAM superfamily enzyme YgiQ (UPF0313 family)